MSRVSRGPSDRGGGSRSEPAGAAILAELFDDRGDRSSRVLRGIMAGALVGAAIAGLVLRARQEGRTTDRS